MIQPVRAYLKTAFPVGSLRARLVRGTFWALVGTVISQGLGLAAVVVVARLLGKVGFGELAMIRSTVGMFGVFAGLGLGLTATKHVAEFRATDPARAGRIIGMSSLVALFSGGLLSIAVFLLAPYLATHPINAPHLMLELEIASGLLLVNALAGAQTGALAGFEAFKTIAKVNVLRGLLNFPLMLAGVYFWGLRGGVCALVAVAAIGWILNHAALRIHAREAHIPVTYRDVRVELPILWKFSLPAVLSGAMVGPVTWAARAVIANQPEGYAQLGLFGAASRFKTLLLLAGGPLGAVLLPMMCSREGAASDRFMRTNILVSWALGVFPALLLICFPELVSLLFGPDYAGVQFTRTVVLVMCFSCVVMYKQGLARVLAARSMLWWGLLSNGFWAIALLASVFGMARWGAVGLAGSFAIAYVLNTVVFVPLYVIKGLVPKATIVSREAGLIWAVIVAVAVVTLVGTPVALRLVVFPLAAMVALLAFANIHAPGWWKPLLRIKWAAKGT